MTNAVKSVFLSVGSILCAGTMLSADAKTLTWSGGAAGDVNAAANWGGQTPQAGDVLIFNGTVALSGEGGFGLGDAATRTTFQVESGYKVTFGLQFTGAGQIVKTSAGEISVGSAAFGSEFSGGVRVEGGTLSFARSNAALVGFGSGEIEIVATGNSGAQIMLNGWQTYLSNSVRITGSTASCGCSVHLGQGSRIYGDVVSDGDFKIITDWHETGDSDGIFGDVSAPGKTITVAKLWNSDPYTMCFGGEVDASIVNEWGSIEFRGVSTVPENALTLSNAAGKFGIGASWGGTNITVKGGSASLVLANADSISSESTIRLLSSAKIALADTARVYVKALFVSGEEVPCGRYTSENLSNAITGTGELFVGIEPPRNLTWVGGAEGDISVDANWSDEQAPRAGDILVFTNTVALSGEGGFGLGDAATRTTFQVESGCKVTFGLQFTGAGQIVKTSSGEISVGSAAFGSEFSGGVRVEGGTLSFARSNAALVGFGSGEIEVVATGNSGAQIMLNGWQTYLSNSVRITGSTASCGCSVHLGQGSRIYGDVVSDGDFKIITDWHETGDSDGIFGDVSAPGKTITVAKVWNNDPYTMCFGGAVDASIVNEWGAIEFRGVSTVSENALTLSNAAGKFGTGASWGGTNITVKGGSASLNLTESSCISNSAIIRVQGGAKIDISSGVKALAGGLWVDGIEKPAGVYRASNLPGCITGKGRLLVGITGVGSCIILR